MQTDSSLESALVDCRCDGGKAAGQNAGEFLGMAVCTSRGGASDMASALWCAIDQSAVRPMPVQVVVYEYSGQHCPVGWNRYQGTVAPLLQHVECSLSEIERSLLQRFMSSWWLVVKQLCCPHSWFEHPDLYTVDLQHTCCDCVLAGTTLPWNEAPWILHHPQLGFMCRTLLLLPNQCTSGLMVPQCQGSSHHALSFAAGLPTFASNDYKSK